MSPLDLRQIEELLDRKLKDFPTNSDMDNKLKNLITKNDLDDKFVEFSDEVQVIVGKNGAKILDAMNTSTVSEEDFTRLEKKVEALENEIQIA